MIIDIHTHIFPDKIAHSTIQKLQLMSHTRAFTDGTMGALRASMTQSGVDICVVLPVATNPAQVVKVNDISAQIKEQGDGSIVSLGCIHPDFADWHQELARIKSLGLRGIKLHPVYQDVDFDDVRYLRILDRCAQLDLLVLAHAGLDVGFPGKVRCTPAMVLRAVEQVGPLELILAHMGGWRNWDEVLALLPRTGVYLDTSYCLGQVPTNGDGFFTPADLPLMAQSQFMELVRAFGPRRILFGTDSPWGAQAGNLARVRALPLTEEELDAILGGNAQRLLRLPR